ncbi:MAG: MBL fold metallo-hydrolase [Saprospiraceae bacterium]|nr:MBL fold metallo-hydrolase [Saprospiraceae bacterium]
MKVEQIYTGCLAHGAYYIESNGEVAIIDPLREVTPYLQKAEKDGAKIKYILETHFHADFVSGHLDLAQKTGAKIVYGPTAQPGFSAHVATDGELLPLGNVKIKVLHTPGHTMESACFLLFDESGKEVAIFSGDTLFIGDVGRPDLAQKAANMTQEQLAETLFDSLRNQVMPLSDEIIVYPGHGAGSACGKNMSKETTDTLGNQKKVNYALRSDMTKAEFVKEVLTGLMPPPGYFPQNVMMNKLGYDSIDTVLERGSRPLSPRAFEAAANETEALVLDTRKQDDFAKGFIPNSVNISLDGSFAPWVGVMIPDVKQPLLIVAEPGREEEVITRLARVGYDFCLGYLDGGFDAWKKAGMETDVIEQITVDELADLIASGKEVNLLDVRKASEYGSEHVLIAENAPLDYINESMLKIDRNKTYYVQCAAGYRSMIFISSLRARGFDNLIDVKGGMSEIKKSGKFALSEYVCPTTLL